MRATTSSVALLLATTVLMAAPSGQAPAPAPQQQQPATVFRTGADVVTVDASVQRERRRVHGVGMRLTVVAAVKLIWTAQTRARRAGRTITSGSALLEQEVRSTS